MFPVEEKNPKLERPQMTRSDARNLLPLIPTLVRADKRNAFEKLVRAYIDGAEILRKVGNDWVPDHDPVFNDISVLKVKAGPKPLTLNELRSRFNAKQLKNKITGKVEWLMVNGEKAYMVVVREIVTPETLLKDYVGPDGEILGKLPIEKVSPAEQAAALKKGG